MQYLLIDMLLAKRRLWRRDQVNAEETAVAFARGAIGSNQSEGERRKVTSTTCLNVRCAIVETRVDERELFRLDNLGTK